MGFYSVELQQKFLKLPYNSDLNLQGEALVMGYDDMGYELRKPNLRVIMEHDMDSVGNKNGSATTGSNSGGRGRRGGARGRGNRGGQSGIGRSGGGRSSGGTSFVSATGDPVSGRRCFSCGDPSHCANACPDGNSNGHF